jgi:hypothetical protein
MRRRTPIAVVASTIALVAVLGALLSSPALAEGTHVMLAAGPGAPSASGQAEVELQAGVLKGSVEVEGLPAQPYGSGRFIVAWFVRTDTGNKAFLGPLSEDDSIVLAHGGSGNLNFAATQFTDGAKAGSPIKLGTTGTNLIIVLIENKINGLSPFPVGPVPGPGVAVSGTF